MKNANSFFKLKVYTTCDKEHVMATCMSNPISFIIHQMKAY